MAPLESPPLKVLGVPVLLAFYLSSSEEVFFNFSVFTSGSGKWLAAARSCCQVGRQEAQ
jgi:hypothetical protein